MEWKPPISDEEAAAERGQPQRTPKRAQATSVTKSKETYLLEKSDAEMQHYLKHMPEAAKAQLRESKAQQQAQAQQAQGQQFETIEMPAIEVLEQQELAEPSERNHDLVYDPEQDTPCIKGNQHYFLVSYLRKGVHADRDWYRVWCACSGQRDLDRSMARIREENPYAEWWDIHAMPAGGWCPWPPKDAEQQEYANKEMADFMKAHMENLGKALRHDKERKSELMAQEDVNARVTKEKALKKKHKRWLRRQRERAAALGIGIEDLIEREGRQAQYEAAMGAAQPQWDGDLAKQDEYELITVEEEETLDDGSVEVVEKTIRIKKRTLQEKVIAHHEARQKQLLQQVSDLQLRVETLALALRRQGVDAQGVPALSWAQVQAYNESRDQQATVALEQQRNEWRQEQRRKAAARKAQ